MTYFVRQENVSRETTERLREFEKLVQKWTKVINLVSGGNVAQIWERHIVDSMQVYQNAPKSGTWLDLGSGGGFPGIVAAIMAKEETPLRAFTLVDSDTRKCVFLRTVGRELDLNIHVHSVRITDLVYQNADVLTARALGDLTSLLQHAGDHLTPNGVALFPKGQNWRAEHEAAQEKWSYKLDVVKSETDPNAAILKIKELIRV
jgi:16S rRNA (guanine527-N7)-methyltransferase